MQECYKTLTSTQRHGETALFPHGFLFRKTQCSFYSGKTERSETEKKHRVSFRCFHTRLLFCEFSLSLTLSAFLCMCVPAVAMAFLIRSEFGRS